MEYIDQETINRLDEQLGLMNDDRRTVLAERFNKLIVEISNQLLTELSDQSDQIK